jgi:hypothetical protein
MRDLRDVRERGEASVCGVAAAIVGGAVIGGGASYLSARQAKKAANKATDAQMQMYQQTRTDLAPYMSTGTGALAQLAKLWGIGPGGTGIPDTAGMMSALENFPGYQFGREQGVKALDQSAASRGLLLSGAQIEDAQKFGTNYAIQQGWNPYISQLSDLSRLGESAAAGVGSAGTQTGAGIAQSTLAGGQAAANGIAGVGNALQSGYQQLVNSGGFAGTSPLATADWGPTITGMTPGSIASSPVWNPSTLSTLNPSFG